MRQPDAIRKNNSKMCERVSDKYMTNNLRLKYEKQNENMDLQISFGLLGTEWKI